MATKPPSNMKPTLDKDLDKFTRVEEATLHVTQQLAGLGAGFIFVVLAAIFADIFVTGTAGSAIIIAAVAIGASVGTAIGVAVAALRGVTETVVMRICDIIFAVPPILSAMMLGAFIGTGRFTAIIAIATFI